MAVDPVADAHRHAVCLAVKDAVSIVRRGRDAFEFDPVHRRAAQHLVDEVRTLAPRIPRPMLGAVIQLTWIDLLVSESGPTGRAIATNQRDELWHALSMVALASSHLIGDSLPPPIDPS